SPSSTPPRANSRPRPPPGPRHLRVQACLRDRRARQLDALAIVVEGQAVGLDLRQSPFELLTAGEPAAHALADRPAILSILPQLSIQPGRRYFEIVRLPDRPGHVEQVADLPAHALAIRDADATMLVHEDAQHPARAVGTPIQVDELQPMIPEHGQDDLFDPGVTLVVQHPTPAKVKKWAKPTFSRP